MPWPELRDIATAVMLFAAMLIAGWLGVRQRSGVVLLVLLSVVWLTVDRLWEGPVLIAVTSHNGLVTSDFIGLAGLIAAAVLARCHRPARGR